MAAKLALGVWLTVIAIRHYRKLGKPKPPKKPPRWQTGIDNMRPWYAIALGPLTQPWVLVAAGVTVIVEAKLASWQTYLTLALFCVIATSAFLAMEIYAGFRPEPAQQFLSRLRQHLLHRHLNSLFVCAWPLRRRVLASLSFVGGEPVLGGVTHSGRAAAAMVTVTSARSRADSHLPPI